MNKKFAVINSENNEISLAIKNKFNERCDIVEKEDNLSEYDFVVLTSFEDQKINFNGTILNIHPSLLPAFKGNEAIKQAFLEGVKVSGITIHKVKDDNFYGKIITQAPILIGNDTHFDELEKELIKLGIQIYPKVIESILNDTVFDFCDLFTGGCSGGCSGNCSNCSH